MKVLLLIFVACLSVASAGIPKMIMKKYMMTKVMESCFGEQLLTDMTKEMAEASSECRSQEGPPLAQEVPQAKLLYMMGNVTCVMRKMKMLTDDNQVDYASIKARITAMPLPEAQLEDLTKGLERCRQFAECLPVGGDGDAADDAPVMAAIAPQMAFFKCFKMAKVESCIRQDFRGEVLPALMLSGMGLHEDRGLGGLIASAMLEEASGGLQPEAP